MSGVGGPSKMFYLKNLSSTEIHRGEPWKDTPQDSVPPRAILDKNFRTQWMTDPKTNYLAYSLFEGLNPSLRLKGPSSADEGNAPVKMFGAVADYDLKLSAEEVNMAIGRMPIKPNFYEVSLSGNARLIFLFEKPINLPSYVFAVFLLSKLPEFLPVRAMAGLDEGAWRTPDRYYTAGSSFTKISDAPVPHDRLIGFLVEVSKKFDWLSPENGPTVPMDVLIPELRKRHPKFANWEGTFEVGAQGPSFWISGSKSTMSAVVRETGLQTFSGSAPKAWYSWSELVGAEFVNAFKQRQIGSAVADIFFDEKSYFSKLPDGSWATDPKENIALFLKVNRGLSDRTRKGEHASEVEQALSFIQRNNRIKTAASFAFYKEGIIEFNGARCLNLHTKKALAPAPGPAVWGSDGQFPWLSEFLDTVFQPRDQLPFFLSWFKYFYTSCYLREPRSGHALFIAGGVSVGKTFLSRGVISQLCGGFAEASALLMGTDSFNAESFDASTWVIDDGSMSLDVRSHKRFSEQIKRVVANPTHRCNGKFAKAVQVPWQGRCIITLNVDEESLRLLPDLDISIREKVMLLRTVSESAVQFLPQSEMENMLKRELPFLARFLLDMEYPPHTLSKDPRFFVAPHAESSLVTSANHSSASGAFSEILDDFLTEFFKRELDADRWAGTALQLHRQILTDPTMAVPLHRYDSLAIGRHLSTLLNKNTFDIKTEPGEHNRIFVIGRGVRYPKKINGHRVPQAENSRFEKL